MERKTGNFGNDPVHNIQINLWSTTFIVKHNIK